MIAQFIRLRLENKGLPADLANDAAELIAPTLPPDVLPSNADLALLLQTLVELYRIDKNSEQTLLALADSLIK